MHDPHVLLLKAIATLTNDPPESAGGVRRLLAAHLDSAELFALEQITVKEAAGILTLGDLLDLMKKEV